MAETNDLSVNILIGFMLLALAILLRVVWKWGHAQGILDEYNRTHWRHK